MFRSKTRDIIIPQSEHARLAADLAVFWGNKDFNRPPVDFETFLKAVLLHDRAFGYFDLHAIGDMEDEVWIRLQRRGLVGEDSDRLCDLLIQQHIHRLSGYLKGPAAKEFRAEVGRNIETEIELRKLNRDALERADRILAFCDSVAFDFSFEHPVHSSAFVYASNDSAAETEVQYQIHPGGEIQVSPWPFLGDEQRGLILGYKAASYPRTPEPVFLPYHLIPGMW